jgi:ABC-type transporter Mla subunit MlaD
MIGRSRTRTTRRHGPRPASVALAGLVTVGLIVGFIWLAENSYNGIPFLNYRILRVSLPNVGHLQQHDPVDIAGVRVGQVLGESTRDNRALVKLQLLGVGPLAANTQAVVRADGLLGERYVELEPGTSHEMLRSGATIEMGSNSFTNGIPETLNLFDAKTRTGLGDMLNGLGQGVLGRGSAISAAIHVGGPSGADFDTAADAILARAGVAENFLPFTDSGVTALDSARVNLADMLKPVAAGLEPLIDRRSATERAVAVAPSTLQSVDSGLGSPADRLLTAFRSVAGAADAVLPVAPRGLRAATALLRGGATPLRATKQVFDQVSEAVPATLKILAALKPNLTPLRGLLTNSDTLVSDLAQRGCDIQSMVTGARSLVNYGTEPGGGFGPDNGFPLSAVIAPAEGGSVTSAGVYPTEDPYPAPCAYSPGATIDQSTLLNVLSQVFP